MKKILNKKKIRLVTLLVLISVAGWFFVWYFVYVLDDKELSSAVRTGKIRSIVQVEAISTLGISGDKIVVNGAPNFLLGVSYFDAMNWRISDFESLANKQFNLIRIWIDWPEGGISADWSDWQNYNSFFDNQGNLLHKRDLIDLVRSANQYGIVVDVTIMHGSSFGGRFSLRENAVRSIVSTLKDEPNVFFDIMNEYRVAGPKRYALTSSELRSLISTAKNEYSTSILFASSEYINQYEFLLKQNIDTDLNVGFSLLAPHFPRMKDWYSKTDQRILSMKNYLSSKRKKIPIYLQEEHRIGYKEASFSKDEFLQAAKEAVDAGAAGWIFHTAAGFDMATSDFFDNLSSEEIDTINSLGDEVFGKDQ